MNLSPEFERTIREVGAADAAPADVIALSDFYLSHPGAPTPWHERWAEGAYLAYFLPLNYARVRETFREVRRFLPDERVGAIVDWGSGTGAVHFALEDEIDFAPRPFHCVERSAEAVRLHRRLAGARRGRWTPRFDSPRTIAPGTLGVFSYSFLEMQGDLPDLDSFDHLLIVEPSTQDCGRRLMGWRAKLLERGFAALAPCTHDGACPLLTESARDWCHHRLPFEAPEWWRDLEARLPMANRTLTLSYLLVSRTVRDLEWRGAARVIGDTLEERGKTRQMICRGPHREFLSWLHRHGRPPTIARGALVRGVETTEPKGGELRVTETTRLSIES